MTQLNTSSLGNEVSNGINEGGSAVHEEEESGIALIGKQESCVRKRSNQLYESCGCRYAQVFEVRGTIRECDDQSGVEGVECSRRSRHHRVY